ncbi:N-acetylmuramoyl-L-alanine amidase [Plantactinospora sp. S1510]|uniref:N-acetylmuramoyl-L-alanine amidase n=1 Tax=Plantactinospora alkalitolerans TaxID=2789879 RepID=A0ABS0HA32_9ACTN|nr:N-acetylmuramoyl-L-alanine amidase [Plantactinospora alkalitolerans]MBF9135335.1 N-acetylmuramoyl-L-alanine amidase [Plantactinospora alkalitolerans]
MARLTWLADVLRGAGLTVHEVAGWRTRGANSLSTIRGITCHATAGSRNATDAGEINVLINGSTTAPPPIAQLYLSRTGAWHVVASGRCNHNKTGWAGPNKGYGNSNLLGIEAANDNHGEPWPARQYESYVRGVAALVKRLGIPVSRVAGHKEHQPAAGRPAGERSTKTDPTFDMNRFRRDVAAVLAGDDQEEDVDDATINKIAARAGQATVRQLMGRTGPTVEQALQPMPAKLAQILANQQVLLGKDWVDEEQIVNGVLAGLGSKDLDEVATALKAAFGDRVDELAAKLTADAAS